MEFYDVIDNRRTVREFLDKEVDFEAVKRILEAGNKAPTWNHNRNWSYIVLRTDFRIRRSFLRLVLASDCLNVI